MKNKEVTFWTLAVAIIGAGILYYSLNNNTDSAKVNNVDTVINQISTTSVNNTNITTQYALFDVAKHNNQTSCWTVVDGKIYDITSFISSHPAGVSKILRGCGIDATNIYGRVGAHDVSKLTDFVVGIIK
jgi:cytochrome b involved in lipid metabolism